jgi:transposase
MRGPPVCLRALTAGEASAVESLARSRTAPARRVERARVVLRASRGETPPAIAAALGLDAETVRRRIRRFNAEGLAAFDDHHRSGRPATYSADEVAVVIAAALTDPRRLGLPFASWTLDRLAAYLLEYKGIAMRRSRMDEILLAEGLRWRRHETWFGERMDPEFAEKRGGSRRSTPHRPRAASSFASMRWDRSAPRVTQAASQSGGGRQRLAALDRKSIMAGAARATSSAPSVQPRAPLSPSPIRAVGAAIGWPSWRRSRAGCRRRSSGSTRSPII